MVRFLLVLSVLPLLCLLPNCGQSKERTNTAISLTSLNLTERADTLVKLSQKIKHTTETELKIKYQLLFFQFFPDNFQSLDSLYGYDEETGPSLLYNEAVDHIIEVYFNLDNISLEEFARRNIEIAFCGEWEADAINYFQHGLRISTKSNTILYCKLLSKYSNDKIYSFWHFYFDGPHPENAKTEFESLQKEVGNCNPNIAKQMERAYEELISKKAH